MGNTATGTVRIIDNEGSVHATKTPTGWLSTYADEVFSDADVTAFEAIAAGATDEWPPSALNGNRTWYGMAAEVSS